MNPVRRLLIGGAMAAGVITGGAIGASFLGTASAQTSSTTQAPAATAPADGAGRHGADGTKGPHQANGITEAVLTGNDLAKTTAAAQAAVPDGTIERAETDADGDVYEVDMTKSDGSQFTSSTATSSSPRPSPAEADPCSELRGDRAPQLRRSRHRLSG